MDSEKEFLCVYSLLCLFPFVNLFVLPVPIPIPGYTPLIFNVSTGLNTTVLNKPSLSFSFSVKTNQTLDPSSNSSTNTSTGQTCFSQRCKYPNRCCPGFYCTVLPWAPNVPGICTKFLIFNDVSIAKTTTTERTEILEENEGEINNDYIDDNDDGDDDDDIDNGVGNQNGDNTGEKNENTNNGLVSQFQQFASSSSSILNVLKETPLWTSTIEPELPPSVAPPQTIMPPQTMTEQIGSWLSNLNPGNYLGYLQIDKLNPLYISPYFLQRFGGLPLKYIVKGEKVEPIKSWDES